MTRGMQNCFRAHPDIYGSELEGDEDDDELDTPIPASGEPIDPKADHPVPSPSPAAAAPESSPAPSSPTDTPRSSPPPEAPVSSIPPPASTEPHPPASTEPHPPASEDHELAGTKKEEAERVRESPRKVSETTSLVMESDAVPRQAHDAKDR
jgi:mitochondrial intermembrane space import and assembly protein 40